MDARNKRLKLMDEICEMLNEIPASSISTLFGLSAGYIQKKLAIRYKFNDNYVKCLVLLKRYIYHVFDS